MSHRGITRRRFIQHSAGAAAATSAIAAWPGPSAVGASPRSTLGLGLIGCGQRGTAAAHAMLAATEGVELVAMADVASARLVQSRSRLAERGHAAKLKVDQARCLAGPDAGARLIENPAVDLVIDATPPAFRPPHLRQAVEAGKHVFLETPAAVDLAGCGSVLESSRLAEAKSLSLVAGLMHRRQDSCIEAMRQIHDGRLGQLIAGQGYCMTSRRLWQLRQPGESKADWQLRNWLHVPSLSGGHLVEQAVHQLDVLNHAFGGPPLSALAQGTDEISPDQNGAGFSVELTYPGDVRIHLQTRQADDAPPRVGNRLVGTAGVAEIRSGGAVLRSHDGQVWLDRQSANDPQREQMVALVEAIRQGRPINEADALAQSTLAAIMARQSAAASELVTWERIRRAQGSLAS